VGRQLSSSEDFSVFAVRTRRPVAGEQSMPIPVYSTPSPVLAPRPCPAIRSLPFPRALRRANYTLRTSMGKTAPMLISSMAVYDTGSRGRRREGEYVSTVPSRPQRSLYQADSPFWTDCSCSWSFCTFSYLVCGDTAASRERISNPHLWYDHTLLHHQGY